MNCEKATEILQNDEYFRNKWQEIQSQVLSMLDFCIPLSRDSATTLLW